MRVCMTPSPATLLSSSLCYGTTNSSCSYRLSVCHHCLSCTEPVVILSFPVYISGMKTVQSMDRYKERIHKCRFIYRKRIETKVTCCLASNWNPSLEKAFFNVFIFILFGRGMDRPGRVGINEGEKSRLYTVPNANGRRGPIQSPIPFLEKKLVGRDSTGRNPHQATTRGM